MSDFQYQTAREIVGLWIANFIVFVVVSMAIGGDAINGKVVDGHLFLASHGKLTEVSEAVFTYSWWHATSTLVTAPLAMVARFLARREKAARRRKAQGVIRRNWRIDII